MRRYKAFWRLLKWKHPRLVVWLVVLLYVILFALLWAQTSLFLVAVDGQSMTPTYNPGRVIVATRKLDYLGKGDVVIAKVNGDIVIKRIALTPGEMYLDANGDLLTMNNSGIKGMYKRVHMFNTHQHRIRGTLPDISITKVPSGCVYLLGDNLQISEDSRAYGPVPVDQIIGKVVK